MMFALRQMMSLSLMMFTLWMMSASPNDLANIASFCGKAVIHHYTARCNIISHSDISFHIALPPLLCYNTLKGGDASEQKIYCVQYTFNSLFCSFSYLYQSFYRLCNRKRYWLEYYVWDFRFTTCVCVCNFTVLFRFFWWMCWNCL